MTNANLKFAASVIKAARAVETWGESLKTARLEGTPEDIDFCRQSLAIAEKTLAEMNVNIAPVQE